MKISDLSKKLNSSLREFRSLAVSAFDKSLASRAAGKIRQSFLSLKTRVCGVFFASFGFYTLLIAILLGLFTDREVDMGAIYGGTVCFFAAVPLLFSKGNISSELTGSKVGEVICKYLNVRKESIQKNTYSGTLSQGFVCGVVCGVLTIIFPFKTVIMWLLMAVVAGVIFCSPEAGLTFCVIFMFFGEVSMLKLVLVLTTLSYLFKLFRSKRYFCVKKSDIPVLIFALYTAGAAVITTTDSALYGAWRYAFLTLVYFLCISLLRDRERIAKLLYLACVTLGVLSAFYILGIALHNIVPLQGLADRDYFLSRIGALHTFSKDFGAVAMAALIPICVAFILRSSNDHSRFTMYLCLGSMSVHLLITEQLAFFAAAFVSTFLLLIVLGSRRIYLALATFMAGFTLLLYAGGFGEVLYRYILRQILEAYTQAQGGTAASIPIAGKYLLSGHGFAQSSPEGVGFFYRLFSDMGVIGFVLLCVVVVGAFISLGVILAQSRKGGRSALSLGHIDPGYASSLHHVSAGLFCSMFSVLLVALFCDFYTDIITYMFLFVSLGCGSAYARAGKRDLEKMSNAGESENTAECAVLNIRG